MKVHCDIRLVDAERDQYSVTERSSIAPNVNICLYFSICKYFSTYHFAGRVTHPLPPTPSPPFPSSASPSSGNIRDCVREITSYYYFYSNVNRILRANVNVMRPEH